MEEFAFAEKELRELGFDVWHTGGNCRAFGKGFNDLEGGPRILVTNEDAKLPTAEGPNVVGFYRDEELQDGINFYGLRTLPDLLEAIRKAEEILQMRVGRRAKFVHGICRYPHFNIPAGATGTIVRVDEECLSVKLDEPVDGAEEWENCVQFYDGTFLGNAGGRDNWENFAGEVEFI